jgi:hypothetical protein
MEGVMHLGDTVHVIYVIYDALANLPYSLSRALCMHL